MSNKTRMPEELFGELSILATFFVIKMIEGPGSNYEPPRTLRLIDCLVLRLWTHHVSAATPVESSSRYSELERSTSHACLVLSAMPALSVGLACHASRISDKSFTKTSTDDDQKKVRTTRHTRIYNGHLLANRYAFTRPHARKRNTWSGRWKDQDKLAKNTMLDYHQCPNRNITR